MWGNKDRKESFLNHALVFIVGAIVYYWVVVVIYRGGGDDTNFLTQSEGMSAFEWVAKRYMTRSGRLLSEFYIWLFARLPLQAFKVYDLLMHVLLAEILYEFCVILGNAKNKLTCLICVFVPYLMNNAAYVDGSLWVTGSMNYLWVAVPGLYGVLLLIKGYALKDANGLGKVETVLLFVMTMLASTSSEQMGVLIIFLLAVICLCNFRTDKFIIPLSLFIANTAGFMACVIFCPGVKQRRAEEVQKYIEDFDTVPLLLKAQYNIRWCFNSIINRMGWLIVALLAVFAIYLILHKKNEWLFAPVIAIFVLIFRTQFSKFLKFQAKWGYNDFSTFTYVAMLLWFTLGALVVVEALKAADIRELSLVKLLPFILVIAFLLQVIGITASPTMYASGRRVMYHPSMVAIILLFYLMAKLKDSKHYLYIQLAVLLVGMYGYAGILNTMADGFVYHLG